MYRTRLALSAAVVTNNGLAQLLRAPFRALGTDLMTTLSALDERLILLYTIWMVSAEHVDTLLSFRAHHFLHDISAAVELAKNQ